MADRHAIHEHPMVQVPDAIRTVLQITAQHYAAQSSSSHCCTTQTLALADLQVGMQVADDVNMMEPGYPPYAASIMDGYAISSADTLLSRSKAQQPQQSQFTATHVIVDQVFAGDEDTNVSNPMHDTKEPPKQLPTAVYVTTGAKIPSGYDCVVPVEQVDVWQARQHLCVSSDAIVAPHMWIRPPGCDLPAHSVVVPRGARLDAVSLALLRQAGVSTVDVNAPIRIGVLSTGNELIYHNDDVSGREWSLQQDGTRGLIPDVNRPLLLSLWQQQPGCEVVDCGVGRDDDLPALVQTVQKAVNTCHVLITTGGISMGVTDCMERVLVQELGGTLHFGRLHMKPGKPTTFVTVPRSGPQPPCLVFALPGNPVSAYVCSQLLVQPCVHFLRQEPPDSNNGNNDDNNVSSRVENALVHTEVQATLLQTLKLDPERPEYHRVQVQSATQNDGSITFTATSTGTQRSSRLASLRDANGLALLPQATTHQTQVKEGEKVTVLLLSPAPFLPQPTVVTSRHLNPPRSKPPLQVAIVHFGSTNEIPSDLATTVETALVGSKSGSVTVAAQHARVVDSAATDIWDESHMKARPDLLFLVSAVDQIPQALKWHHAAAQQLRQTHLQQVADAMGQQLRAGAASVNPHAALWDVVVGVRQQPHERHTCLVVLLTNQGLEGALGHARGLLKHAVQIAQNKSGGGHDHHHHHRH